METVMTKGNAYAMLGSQEIIVTYVLGLEPFLLVLVCIVGRVVKGERGEIIDERTKFTNRRRCT